MNGNLLAPMIAVIIFGCDSGSGDKSNSESQLDSSHNSSNARIQNALKDSGAMLPSGTYAVSEAQARHDEVKSRNLPGDRGVFADMHNRQGITLLPAQKKSSFALNDLNAEAVAVDQSVDRGEQCSGAEAQRVCATACATATANAYAFAFAHASATACAWAQAWACAFTFRPFSQVCSWASSQSCVSSFSSAFAAAFVSDTDTVCRTQCSN